MIDITKSEFDICNRVSQAITDEYGDHAEARDYPETERNTVIVWAVSGIVENGGFRYLFGSILPGDPDWTFTVAAFENTGCLKAVQTIKEALCLFPNCKPPLNDKERISWFEKQPEETRNRLDTEFWNELDNITATLAKYIKESNLDKVYQVNTTGN